MYNKTLKINNNLELNEKINHNVDFKEILEDIYINKFDKIKTFSNLYDYYISRYR